MCALVRDTVWAALAVTSRCVGPNEGITKNFRCAHEQSNIALDLDDPLLTSGDAAATMSAKSFDFTAKTLEECITDRNKDVVKTAGGVAGIAAKLKTDIKLGLSREQLGTKRARSARTRSGRMNSSIPLQRRFCSFVPRP